MFDYSTKSVKERLKDAKILSVFTVLHGNAVLKIINAAHCQLTVDAYDGDKIRTVLFAFSTALTRTSLTYTYTNTYLMS